MHSATSWYDMKYTAMLSSIIHSYSLRKCVVRYAALKATEYQCTGDGLTPDSKHISQSSQSTFLPPMHEAFFVTRPSSRSILGSMCLDLHYCGI